MDRATKESSYHCRGRVAIGRASTQLWRLQDKIKADMFYFEEAQSHQDETDLYSALKLLKDADEILRRVAKIR